MADRSASSRLSVFGSLKPLLRFALAYKGRIAAAMVCLAVASGATLAVPLAVQRMVDHGFSQGESAAIHTSFATLILIAAVLAVSSALRYYFVISIGERVVADLRAGLFRHLVLLDPPFFDALKSGEIVSRLSADTTQIKSAFGASVSIALRNGVLFFGAVVLMVLTSPKLSGLVLLAIPLIVLPLVFSGREVRKRSREAQDRLADAMAYAGERIGAVRILQAFGMESAVATRFGTASEDAFQAVRASIKARAVLTGAAIFLILASVVGVLWYGAQDVLSGQLSAGILSQFILYAVFAASSLGQLSEVYGELAQAAGAGERLADLLQMRAVIHAPQNPAAMLDPSPGTISLIDVSFTYPGREIAAIDRLTFHVAKGERIAIVGASGAGKSTLFQLLLRFYDPQSGTVLVDGLPVQAVDPAALRARLALVPQEPVIFAASIMENLLFGRMNASEAQVRRAARLAHAEDFIEALPQGYATEIGERGVTLSGGQRQRLAIARAILKDAPILLLDEATSALDAASERAVQQALDELMKGRTTLVIAHRFATIRSADRILVMDRGRIVEEGTHDDLTAKEGFYARLAHLQFDGSFRNQ